MRALPQVARRYLIGVWCAALFAALLSCMLFPLAMVRPTSLLVAVVFAALLDGADLLTLRLPNGRAVSLALAPLIAGLSALEWPLPLVVVALGTYSAALAHPTPLWRPHFT